MERFACHARQWTRATLSHLRPPQGGIVAAPRSPLHPAGRGRGQCRRHPVHGWPQPPGPACAPDVVIVAVNHDQDVMPSSIRPRPDRVSPSAQPREASIHPHFIIPSSTYGDQQCLPERKARDPVGRLAPSRRALLFCPPTRHALRDSVTPDTPPPTPRGTRSCC